MAGLDAGTRAAVLAGRLGEGMDIDGDEPGGEAEGTNGGPEDLQQVGRGARQTQTGCSHDDSLMMSH
jgi:hypothetical protein